MQLGRNAEYSIKALVDLAEVGEATSAAISRRRAVPKAYAVKVLRLLEQAGLVRSKRGRGGGYSLARPAHRITLLEAVEVAQGEIGINRCLFSRDGRCWENGHCLLHSVWERLWGAAVEELRGVTIADLAAAGAAPDRAF